MDRILDILLVNRPGLKTKWWHRLFEVLIFGSTAFFFLLFSYQTISSSNWQTKVYSTYSFEPSFTSTSGEIIVCTLKSQKNNSPLINCGDIKDSSDFLTRFTKGQGTGDNLKKLRQETGLTDDGIVNLGINNGDFSNIEVKLSPRLLFFILLRDLFQIIFLTLFWFVFFSAIFYRSLLYIIYGPNKKLARRPKKING